MHQPCCTPIHGAGTKCITETSAFARGKAFDPARAAACVDALRGESSAVGYCGRGPDALACAGVFKSLEPKAPDVACRSVFDGLRSRRSQVRILPGGNKCDPAASLVCDTNLTKCIPDTAVYEETCSGAAALLR